MVLNDTAVEIRPNLLRKAYSLLSGVDIGNSPISTLNFPELADAGNLASVVTDKKFPLHMINDDSQGLGSNTGGVVVIGDQTNPDDSYTKTLISKTYNANPGAATDADIYEVTAGKTFYLTAIHFQKTTAELVTWKNGTGGSTVMLFRVGATSNTQYTYPSPVVFTDDVTINQPTSETSVITIVGFEQ